MEAEHPLWCLLKGSAEKEEEEEEEDKAGV